MRLFVAAAAGQPESTSIRSEAALGKLRTAAVRRISLDDASDCTWQRFYVVDSGGISRSVAVSAFLARKAIAIQNRSRTVAGDCNGSRHWFSIVATWPLTVIDFVHA